MSTRALALGSVTSLALLASGALAADLPIRSPAPAPAPVFVAAHSWTGLYLGVNAGYAWGRHNNQLTVPATVNGVANAIVPGAAAEWLIQGNGNHRSDGFTGGLTLGYNYQMGAFVWGVEADLSYLGLSGNRLTGGAASPFGIRVNDVVDSDWFGTARIRLGFAAGSALFYVTGGAALSDISVSRLNDNTVDGCPPVGGGFGRCHQGKSKFDFGWTLGGGMEYAFTNNWSTKLEYLYADFGRERYRTISASFPGQGLDNSHRTRLHIVRAGLNYRFGGPAARPVVAAY
ncbi:MAG: porin family protein [Beijerinckiaceae bacterium]|nr:porin family protein [Beijerinckiaceae bacterium]